MKFQFSILTMLICTAVLAVVSAISVRLDVVEMKNVLVTFENHGSNEDRIFVGTLTPTGKYDVLSQYIRDWPVPRPPMAVDILGRLLYWGLPAQGVSLGLLWFARQLVRRMQ